MILLGMWGRNYSPTGVLAAFPANAWQYFAEHAEELAAWVDGYQAPPWSLTQSGMSPTGDGYGTKEYRNLNNTFWGGVNGEQNLRVFIAVAHANGQVVSGDFPFRQMDGEDPGHPGVFSNDGRRGATTASWFQCFDQPGETIPPFVAQDDIPNTSGDTPYGRVRSLQHCIPEGATEADTVDILRFFRGLGVDLARQDEAKAFHVQSMARIVASCPQIKFYGEYMSGQPTEIADYILTPPMNAMMGIEDYPMYWHLQTACNSYDATQLTKDGFFGFFQWRPDLAVGFAGNPDVTPSRGVDGGISEQIDFNLGIAYAIVLNLPLRHVVVDAQHYFASSDTFPKCFNLKAIIDKLAWISRTFAFGGFELRWLDKDICCFTRDGDGGEFGWSGGLLIAINFNTDTERTIEVQTMWDEGKWVHNYFDLGDWTIGAGGRVTITVPKNTDSNGQSILALAPGGVNHAVAMKPKPTTQIIYGAADLIIKQAVNGLNPILPISIYGTPTAITLTPDKTGWTAASKLSVTEIHANGITSFQLRGTALPATGSAFELEYTYTSPKKVVAAEMQHNQGLLN